MQGNSHLIRLLTLALCGEDDGLPSLGPLRKARLRRCSAPPQSEPARCSWTRFAPRFQVKVEALEETLDRFARFFSEPLLTKAGVGRGCESGGVERTWEEGVFLVVRAGVIYGDIL